MKLFKNRNASDSIHWFQGHREPPLLLPFPSSATVRAEPFGDGVAEPRPRLPGERATARPDRHAQGETGRVVSPPTRSVPRPAEVAHPSLVERRAADAGTDQGWARLRAEDDPGAEETPRPPAAPRRHLQPTARPAPRPDAAPAVDVPRLNHGARPRRIRLTDRCAIADDHVNPARQAPDEFLAAIRRAAIASSSAPKPRKWPKRRQGACFQRRAATTWDLVPHHQIRIPARDDFAFFGLIGSKTKRARFIHRSRPLGLAPEAIARLTCLIGVPGVEARSGGDRGVGEWRSCSWRAAAPRLTDAGQRSTSAAASSTFTV